MPYTLPYLDHPNDFAKMLSLRALGELAAPEAEARATDLLAHPSFAVANAAAEALGKIGRANGSVKAVDALAAAAVLPEQPLAGDADRRARRDAQPGRDPPPARDREELPSPALASGLERRRAGRAGDHSASRRPRGRGPRPSPSQRPTRSRRTAESESGGLLGHVRRLFGGK